MSPGPLARTAVLARCVTKLIFRSNRSANIGHFVFVNKFFKMSNIFLLFKRARRCVEPRWRTVAVALSMVIFFYGCLVSG